MNEAVICRRPRVGPRSKARGEAPRHTPPRPRHDPREAGSETSNATTRGRELEAAARARRARTRSSRAAAPRTSRGNRWVPARTGAQPDAQSAAKQRAIRAATPNCAQVQIEAPPWPSPCTTRTTRAQGCCSRARRKNTPPTRGGGDTETAERPHAFGGQPRPPGCSHVSAPRRQIPPVAPHSSTAFYRRLPRGIE